MPKNKKNWQLANFRRSGTFPFLRLPPEIRNHIYQLSMPSDFPATFYSKRSPTMDGWVRKTVKGLRGTSSFLLINKQIHIETRALLYGRRFTFTSLWSLNDFLDEIGCNRDLITEIAITQGTFLETKRKKLDFRYVKLTSRIADLKTLQRFFVPREPCYSWRPRDGVHVHAYHISNRFKVALQEWRTRLGDRKTANMFKYISKNGKHSDDGLLARKLIAKWKRDKILEQPYIAS